MARQVAVLLLLCARLRDFHRRRGLSVLDPGAAVGNTSRAGVYRGGGLFVLGSLFAPSELLGPENNQACCEREIVRGAVPGGLFSSPPRFTHVWCLGAGEDVKRR